MKKHDDRFAILRDLLQQAGPEYSTRKDAAESQVIRWEYYSREACEPRPWLAERLEIKRGRRLKGPTARAYAYGFDKAGRLMVRRAPKIRHEPQQEEFFAHSKGGVTGITYDTSPKHRPYRASVQKWREGKIVACDMLDPDGALLETYIYKGDRLDRVESVAITTAETFTMKFKMLYDSIGDLLGIERDGVPIYWNPSKVIKKP